MKTGTLKVYYVTNGKDYLVQVEDSSQFGFSLLSDDQSWPGGFGSGWHSWHIVPKSKVPTHIRKQLDFLFDFSEEVME